MKKKSGIALTIAIVLAIVCMVPAIAEESQPVPSAAEAAPEAAPMPIYGLQLWRDEVTGELRGPTAKEAAQISALMQKMFGARKTAPRVIADKSGMLSVELDESMMEFTVMRKTADGRLETDCVDDADQALELIGMSANRIAREEE